MNRRGFLAATAVAPTSVRAATPDAGIAAGARADGPKAAKLGRLKQSVSRWCYSRIPLDDLCRAAADMGLAAIDLLHEPEWDVPRKYGLVCSMAYAGSESIPDGMNNPANHDPIVKAFTQSLPRAAKAGVANVITFFGNRNGMPDRQAIDNCVRGLNRIKSIAEDANITVCVELLNSKVDHADYQGDRTAFGVEVVKAVNSPRVKLLYDIYHMQIMEGDIIRTIQANRNWIGHFHTGGVPGRHELDDTQELNWRAICKAIVATGYQGFVAHEFVPAHKADPLGSLRAAAALCDVS